METVKIDVHHSVDRCVCCGIEVPEGQMVCSQCEEKIKKTTGSTTANNRPRSEKPK